MHACPPRCPVPDYHIPSYASTIIFRLTQCYPIPTGARERRGDAGVAARRPRVGGVVAERQPDAVGRVGYNDFDIIMAHLSPRFFSLACTERRSRSAGLRGLHRSTVTTSSWSRFCADWRYFRLCSVCRNWGFAGPANIIGTIEGRKDLKGGRLSTQRITANNSDSGKCFTSICYSADGRCTATSTSI